jgi:NADH dehydrogenase [ubiquinone] 1 alpha subcomplex assembly factor 6
MSGLTPIGSVVRTRDHDRFLTVLFAPAECREALFALYAFNYEIAKTREMVSEAALGQMRLQWWRDSIAAIYAGGPVRRHEVAEPLAAVIRAYDLTWEHFESLIDAREADLADAPPATLADLEAYAEASAAPLVLLALEVLGVKDEAAVSAGRAVGTAYALTGLLRAAAFHARARRIYLPADMLAAAGVEPHRTLFELKPDPRLAGIASAIADRARARLATARAFRHAVSRRARPALLPAVLAARSLKRLERAKYELLSPRLGRSDTEAVAALAFAMVSGRY